MHQVETPQIFRIALCRDARECLARERPLSNGKTYDRDIVTLDRDGRTTVRPYKSLLVKFSGR